MTKYENLLLHKCTVKCILRVFMSAINHIHILLPAKMTIKFLQLGQNYVILKCFNHTVLLQICVVEFFLYLYIFASNDLYAV